jgi:hypothetical protein
VGACQESGPGALRDEIIIRLGGSGLLPALGPQGLAG